MSDPTAFQTDSTNPFKEINCFKGALKYMYSASIVDKAALVWSFELHKTGQLPIDIIYPVRLRKQVGS